MKVYLDHNATTPVSEKVFEEMTPFLKNNFGNPSSLHSFGQEARRGLDLARERVAGFLKAEPGEIIFTSGGTEANNLLIKGVAFSRKSKGNHIITSSIEHPAVLSTCKLLEKQGFEATYIPVDSDGIVILSELEKAITEKTVLISVMTANNEVGTIQPIREIREIIGQRDIVFHTDAVQGAGKVDLNVRALGVDALSISAHKIYGPKGIGALYLRKKTRIQPLITGGHQERNLRSGTENLPGIAGLGRACEIAAAELPEFNENVSFLRDKLESLIVKKIPATYRNGHKEKRTLNTLNISFRFVEGESILMNLDLKGIAVSTGSACSSGTLEPSHVLLAMGLTAEEAHGSIRFSLGKSNTLREIEYVVDSLVEVIGKLRAMSPLYSDWIHSKVKV